MIMNPITNEVIAEGNFQSVSNWQSIEFVTITNCEEIATDTGFILTGDMNGQTIQCELTQEEYFEGKNFTYNEVAADDILSSINSIQHVTTTICTTFTNLYKLQVNGINVAAFKLYPNQPDSILLIPHIKHWYNSKHFTITLDELPKLIKEFTNANIN